MHVAQLFRICRFVHLPIGSKDPVPEHSVLPIIRLWNTMVNIMCLGIEDHDTKGGKFNIETGMIPSRKHSSNTKKQNRRKCMNLKVQVSAAEVYSEQMIVLSQEELKRVNVDGIIVGTTTQREGK